METGLGPKSAPPQVVDFLKAFHASIKLQRVNEIALHYERGWKELSKRFYAGESWPKVSELPEPVVKDKAFAVVYRLLYYKHQLMTLASSDRPADLKTYAEAWFAYDELVRLIVPDSEAAAQVSATAADWILPAVWVNEILSEYVYHAEKYQRRRAGQAAAPGSEDLAEEPSTPVAAPPAPAFPALPSQAAATPLTEKELDEVWRPADVLRNLHTMVDKTGVRDLLTSGGPGATMPNFRAQVGYFSLVALVRLYGKLGDIGSCLDCAKPLGVGSSDALLARNGQAHASVALSVAWALAVSRRADEALRLVSRTLRHFQQTVRVLEDDRGEERGPRGGVYLRGLADKLLQLGALVVATCPGAPVDDLVRKPLYQKHGELISDISGLDTALAIGGAAGQEAEAKLLARLTPVFDAATPGFMAWTSNASSADAAAAVGANIRRLFAIEMAARLARLARVRASSLRMYTSINLGKMANYANENLAAAATKKAAADAAKAAAAGADAAPTPAEAAAPEAAAVAVAAPQFGPEDMRAALTALKVDLWLSNSPVTAAGAVEAGAGPTASGLYVAQGTGALHVVLSGDVAKVDEARQAFNVAGYFVSAIERMHRMAKDEKARAERAAQAAAGGAPEGAGGYSYGRERQGGGGYGYGSPAKGEGRQDRGERGERPQREQREGNPAFNSYSQRSGHGTPSGGKRF